MRIAWVLPDLGHYHRARLDRLARMPGVGLDVIVVLGRSGFAEFAATADAAAFRQRLLFAEAPARPLGTRALARALGQSLAASAPEVLFVTGWAQRSANLALALALVRGVPAVMVSDSTAADRRRHWWMELPKRRLLGACAAAFAAGTPQRAYLLRLGMPAARIRLGCDVVDNRHFADGAARARGDAESVRRRLGLPPRYFLCAGRLVADKDPGLVLDAFAALLKRRPRTPEHLVFAGDGPLRPMLEAARQRLGLGGRVHLPGFAAYADLPALYGLASAAVVASWCCEPWGLVINEAMAAALPVLVSRACGAAADLVQEGRNGWTFAPGDAEGLAVLMARVVDDPPAAARLGAAGAALIQAWSPAGFAREALALADIARAGPPRRALGAAALARVLAEVQRHV